MWLRGHNRLTHIKQRGIFRKKKYRYKELQCFFSVQSLMMLMFVQSFMKISQRVSELLSGQTNIQTDSFGKNNMSPCGIIIN